jgi:Cu-Zn family superoxide dismutase
MVCLNFIATFDEKIKGSVKFHQCSPKHEVLVLFDLKGFNPNKIHACHIHEYGDLIDGCKSLGAHLNLKNKEHGTIFFDVENSHTGDLINNIESDNNGIVKFSYSDPRLMLFGNVEKSIIGCSVVIHDGKDDYGFGNNKESKITGNAGGRMVCAIIGKSKNGSL